MEKLVKEIINKLNLEKNVFSIEESENKNMFFQKIIKISFKEHGDRAQIILNAYNKKEFELNNYEKEIEKQILEQKYLFE